MLINKKFKIETAHIVRNCSSERCSKSIHGHSAIIEVRLKSRGLDNGAMVFDFGLFKTASPSIASFIDMFDHTLLIWEKESEKNKAQMMDLSDRYIITSFNPTAEALAFMFLFYIKHLLQNTTFKNGEKDVTIHSVVYHETATGYAEVKEQDLYDQDFAAIFNNMNLLLSATLLEEYGPVLEIGEPLKHVNTPIDSHPSYRETVQTGLPIIQLSYADLDTQAVLNAAQLKTRFLQHTKPADVAIVAIERGGLWHAQRLSYLLDIEKNIFTKSYLTKNKDLFQRFTKVIIADDILDTGRTGWEALEDFEEVANSCDFAFATLAYKVGATKVAGCYYLPGIKVTSWVEFPWESKQGGEK